MPPRKYTDDQLASAVRSSRTMREVLTALGLAQAGGNYESVRKRAEVLGLDLSHLRRRRAISFTEDESADAVGASRSHAQVLKILGIRPGGNQARLKARIEASGLDTSHFLAQGWRRGSTTPVVRRRPLRELLVDGHLVSTNTLKARLIEEGIRERRCEVCRLDRWNGRPIPLELDHVNGRRKDDRLVNLRILCPNCHAQTDTYRGRNIGAGERLS